MAKPSAPAKAKATVKRLAATWTLYGVSAETRKVVGRAAKKTQMPIGKWVDRTLREAAETQLKGGTPNLALPADLLETLSDLSQRVKALSERRSFGGQTLQQVQDTASELGDQASSAYHVLAKRADTAIADLRSWTDETVQDAAKWGSGVIEQLKSAAQGIERLQSRLTGREGPAADAKRLEHRDAAAETAAAGADAVPPAKKRRPRQKA
jgi:hypothetical protein